MNNKIKTITTISLLTTVLLIISPLTINIGIVPFTATTFFIMLYSMVFPMNISLTSIIVYILLGFCGLPVFSNFKSGIQMIFSPTVGFIIAYVLQSLFISFLNKYFVKNKNFIIDYIVLLLSNIILYIFGSIFFSLITNNNFFYSLTVCALPFVLSDNIKIVLVIIIYQRLKSLLP